MKGLFLRFTDNMQADAERNESYHNTGVVANYRDLDDNEKVINGYICEVLDGLCAFDLDELKSEEGLTTQVEVVDFIKKNGVNFGGDYNSESLPNFSVFVADYVDDCPEGVIVNTDLSYFKIIYTS